MFGGRPEVRLAWALGTDLHTDPVLDPQLELILARTHSHKPHPHGLCPPCSVQPPGGDWGTWFSLEGAEETPQDIPESLLSSLCCRFKPG